MRLKFDLTDPDLAHEKTDLSWRQMRLWMKGIEELSNFSQQFKILQKVKSSKHLVYKLLIWCQKWADRHRQLALRWLTPGIG